MKRTCGACDGHRDHDDVDDVHFHCCCYPCACRGAGDVQADHLQDLDQRIDDRQLKAKTFIN